MQAVYRNNQFDHTPSVLNRSSFLQRHEQRAISQVFAGQTLLQVTMCVFPRFRLFPNRDVTGEWQV